MLIGVERCVYSRQAKEVNGFETVKCTLLTINSSLVFTYGSFNEIWHILYGISSEFERR